MYEFIGMRKKENGKRTREAENGDSSNGTTYFTQMYRIPSRQKQQIQLRQTHRILRRKKEENIYSIVNEKYT